MSRPLQQFPGAQHVDLCGTHVVLGWTATVLIFDKDYARCVDSWKFGLNYTTTKPEFLQKLLFD